MFLMWPHPLLDNSSQIYSLDARDFFCVLRFGCQQ